MLPRHFVPLQTPHWEQSQVSYKPIHYIHIYITPPTFSSSILPLFLCPIRGPSHRGSDSSRHQDLHLLLPSKGPKLSLLFPKAKETARNEIQRPCIVTSFGLPKECCSQNSKQNWGMVGRRWEPEISQNGQQSQKPLEIRNLWKCTPIAIPFMEVTIK